MSDHLEILGHLWGISHVQDTMLTIIETLNTFTSFPLLLSPNSAYYHLMLLIIATVFQLIFLLPLLTLYNPFSTQQPERSFYIVN